MTPLDTLFDATGGDDLPLPPELAALYGALRFAAHPGRPHVVANFVTTLDGVVALDDKGTGGGAAISGNNIHDRAVMGLLRAAADAVVVGAGTLRSVPRHRWTADHIFPPLRDAYHALRDTLGKAEPPLNVIVTARGDLDLGLPVFSSGEVPVLIVTTAAGAERLHTRDVPAGVRVDVASDAGRVSASAVLEAVRNSRTCDVMLLEGGPRLIADFFAERQVDELFLTLAPQVAGRDGENARLALVEGAAFAPARPIWGALTGVKRAEGHLFLRYAFASA
jgi:riboflavin biosynthesis pyrimidine reductase